MSADGRPLLLTTEDEAMVRDETIARACVNV